jgi:DNA primase
MKPVTKDLNRYKDITWLMPSIDLEMVLSRLGIEVTSKVGDEYWALCPYHHIRQNKISSDPNWSINVKTGKANCFTGCGGPRYVSNLVGMIMELLDCELEKAVQFATGKGQKEFAELAMVAFNYNAAKIREIKDDSKIEKPDLEWVLKDLERPYVSQRMYEFFMSPPGKKFSTNIRPETVNRYRCFEKTNNFFHDRIIIPYFMHQEIVGFCAIDLLGKEEWIRQHPVQEEKRYKKVLYPFNFKSSECLFGYDDCQKNCDLLILLEGAREVMKLTQEGFPNSVAILGSHLSQMHQRLIAKLNPKKIILMFDGDDAGVATTTKTGDILKKNFPGDRIGKVFLPRGRDPKSLDAKELSVFIGSIRSAKPKD